MRLFGLFLLCLTVMVSAQSTDPLHPIQPGRKHAQIYSADYSPAMCSVPSTDMVDGKYIRYCMQFAPGVTPKCPAPPASKTHWRNRWKAQVGEAYFEPYDCSWKPGTDPRKAAK